MEKIKQTYIAELTEENVINGYYIEDIHGKEKCNELLANGALAIDEDLWQELLTYGQAKLDAKALASKAVTMDETHCLGMECIDCFEKVEQEQVPYEPVKSELEIRLEELEKKLAELTK